MVNIFVHIPDPRRSWINHELYFSHVPRVGETVYVNVDDPSDYTSASEFIVRKVDYHPGRNPKPPERPSSVPSDVELWLVPAGDESPE